MFDKLQKHHIGIIVSDEQRRKIEEGLKESSLHFKTNVMGYMTPFNYFNKNDVPVVAISMSNNNFVRLQRERTLMVNNYVVTGTQWSGNNDYYKATS